MMRPCAPVDQPSFICQVLLRTKLGRRHLKWAGPGCFRPYLEQLEHRCLPSISGINEYVLPQSSLLGSGPESIAIGSDGGIWFTMTSSNQIGRADPNTGNVTNTFTIPTANSEPVGIMTGGGGLWFTELMGNKIGFITFAGGFTEYTIPTANSHSLGITFGSAGFGDTLARVWFTENGANKIGGLDPGNGTIIELTIPTANSSPVGITTLLLNRPAAAPSAVWFTESAGNKLGEIIATPGQAGHFDIFEYAIPTPNSGPDTITTGENGTLWFTESSASNIGEFAFGTFTEFPTPTPNSYPVGIVADSLRGLWFTEASVSKVALITTGGAFTEFATPNQSSFPEAITTKSDGEIWFTENASDHLGQVVLDAPLFVVAPNHSLSKYASDNTSRQLSSGVQSVSVAPDGLAFVVYQDGSLVQQTSTGLTQLASAGLVQSISAGSDGSGDPVVDAVGTDQSLWQHDATGWHQWGGPGQALTASAGPNAVIFAIGVDHSLWEHEAAGWHELAGPGLARSISGGSDSASQPVVDAIGSDHSLWQDDNSIWHQLAAPGLVKAIGAGPADTVFAQGLDNSLWEYDSSWTDIGAAGPPAGAVLGLIGSSSNEGSPVVFIIASDQSVWELTSLWWRRAAAGTAQEIGVAP